MLNTIKTEHNVSEPCRIWVIIQLGMYVKIAGDDNLSFVQRQHFKIQCELSEESISDSN